MNVLHVLLVDIFIYLFLAHSYFNILTKFALFPISKATQN